MNLNARYNQALIDIALQGTGDVTRVIEVAQLNGLSITDDLTAGDELITPVASVDKQRTQVFFNASPNYPASGGSNLFIDDEGGIGGWYIDEPEPIFTVT
jgi:hypothetical protein